MSTFRRARTLFFYIRCLLLLAAIGAPRSGQAAEPADPTQHYIGINGDSYYYWDGSHALADLQGHSEYVNSSWGPATVDTNGWPLGDVQVLVSSDQLAAGVYKLMFQGQAADLYPSYGYVTNLIYNATTNETTADWVLVAPSSGNVWIDFDGTRRTSSAAVNSGFVNLHIWRPGVPTDGSMVFMSEYLAAARKFDLIRFMGEVNANGNPSQHWADRSLMRWAGEPVDTTNSPWGILYEGTDDMYNGTATNTYWPGGFVSDRGRPWELMVLLANATTNDLWVNVPVRVDDDYVIKLAQLIRYGSDGVNPYTNTQANPVYPPLNSGLKVYVEYGNEVWNFGAGFNCFYWVYDLAAAAITDTNSPICYDGVPGIYSALYRYTGYRSSTISLLFRQVYGDAAMMTTVRPILSSQVGNANDVLQTGLQWADGFYRVVRTNNPVVRQVSDLWYGGGGAAYYDSTVSPFYLVTNNGSVTATTDSNLMTEYFEGLPNTNFALNTAVDATWTKAYGLRLTSYEGGPGPGGTALGGTSGSTVAPLYNADPRMKDCMIAAQNIWIANGGDLLTYFTLGGDGPWGFGDATNTVMSTNTVKLQAIDAIRSRAKTNVTLGTLVPAAIPVVTNDAASIIANGGYSDTTAGLYSFGAGSDPASSSMLLIPMHTAVPGAYKFELNYVAAADATVELLLNGQSLGTWTLPAASALTSSSRIIAALTNGLNVARIRVLSGNLALHDLTVLSPYAADPPTFAPPAGAYGASQSITLSSTTSGASIYYTTNGTTPSPLNGILYVAPLVLPVSATIDAIAVADGYTNSPVSAATYLINNINYGALVGWDFTAIGGDATNGTLVSAASTYNDPGAQPSILSRGPGAEAAALQWYDGPGAMNCQSLYTTSLAAAKADGGYFQFSVSPANGWQISLSTLEFVAYEQNYGASSTFVTEYSTNAFATPGVAIATDSGIAGNWDGGTNTVALTGIGNLQNFRGTVTFRLWGFGFGQYQDQGLGQVMGDNLDVAVLGTATSLTNLLTLQPVAGGLQLNWTQGVLMQSDNVSGPWVVTSATSPFTVDPTAAQRYYRVQIQ
jgi:hypothetical protein